MIWWIVFGLVLAVVVGWVVFLARAGELRMHYSDGCYRPIAESAFFGDGSRRRIVPRRGDGERADREHVESCPHTRPPGA